MSLSTLEQTDLAATIARDGWAVTPPIVPQLELDRLVGELARLGRDGGGGARNLLDEAPAVRALATSRAVRSVAAAVLGERCFAVRALLFDGTPQSHCRVAWHQDVTIAVRERAIVTEYGPWSDREGVPHVQPPADMLEGMLVVRVHLDDCVAADGPVRVIPGSHRAGRLSASAIDAWRAGAESVDCVAERGAILAFRPLILHASSPSTNPGDRRVVHLDFAAAELPAPLEWHARVG